MDRSEPPRVRVRRIMVIGGPGSGRAELAQSVARQTGLPVLDLERHCAGAADAAERHARANAAALGEAWILAGNEPATWDWRARRAQLIVFADLPLEQRLWRIARRRLFRAGGGAEGEWAAARRYDREGRPDALRLVGACHARGHPRCVVLRSPAALGWFAGNFAARFAVLP
ncbi:hypothetical protein [Mangrovicoccus sp. HB161399]|uniref:hypothetical protein n=1 Tax=Mangrovicoccus sp. HB161399 TaxID=2720392 RepID=UPI0015555D7E|nr:hypothetical protein [Mangrovicoccus sp. HB161399]